jgi:ketosteroid isomerase-like protein
MKNKILLEFIDAINTANIDSIYSLMSDDHVFIDSQDNKSTGKENMKQGWIGYFALFPDYKIEILETIESDSFICLFGYASGTYKNLKSNDISNYWRIPAAWRAVIRNNQIKQWQVYADNSVVVDIINRNR